MNGGARFDPLDGPVESPAQCVQLLKTQVRPSGIGVGVDEVEPTRRRCGTKRGREDPGWIIRQDGLGTGALAAGDTPRHGVAGWSRCASWLRLLFEQRDNVRPVQDGHG